MLAAGFVAAVWYADKPAPPKAAPTFTDHAVVDQAGYSSNGTLEQPSNTDVTQVQHALDARAEAVLSGDRAAFLGVVDSDVPSFSAHQAVVWANTRQFPIAHLHYTYEGAVEPDRTLHQASFLAKVATTYQLRGFDARPVQVEDGFTFVKKDGTWKLAGVSDADGSFGQHDLPVPWEGLGLASYGDRPTSPSSTAARRRWPAGSSPCATSRGMLAAAAPATTRRPTVVIATSAKSAWRRFHARSR